MNTLKPKETLVIRQIFFVALFLFSSAALRAHAETDAIYGKVMKTQTINCGYAEWPPFLTVDPNTKQVSGIMRDIWDLVGKRLDLKIEWKTLMGWGDIIEAVRANKVDVFCVGIWPDTGRTKNLLLSRPVFYNALYLYSRAGDMRFDNNYEKLNDPAYTVVGQEGDFTATIFNVKFPRARTARVTPMAQQGEMPLNVISKKGDVTLMDVPFANEYSKANPGKIRKVKGAPLTLIPVVLPLAVGEYHFKSMIDTALNDLINDGTIAALIRKYQAQETYAPEPDVKIPALATGTQP
ncbi:MAG: transporter substrate-binding domain-containing protein [Alphaproteobacteria bacterium]|nr:transporter substrate-binding domain-containing protein [Alphaproteobacteria bacterium]